jgi:hypothetical protein
LSRGLRGRRGLELTRIDLGSSLGVIDTKDAVETMADILAEMTDTVPNTPNDTPKALIGSEELQDAANQVIALAVAQRGVDARGRGRLRLLIEGLRDTPGIRLEVVVTLPRVGLA